MPIFVARCRKSVLSRQIGHGHKLALFPQQIIREAGNGAHVDAGADDAAAGDQCADGCKYDCGVERFRRFFVRAAGPNGAQASRELLGRSVGLPRKGEHGAALPFGRLRQDMSSGPKAIEPDLLPLAGDDHERQPIRPAHSRGASAVSAPISPSGKAKRASAMAAVAKPPSRV